MLKKIGMITFMVAGLVVMFVIGASMMITNQATRVEAFNDVTLKDIQEGKIAMREDRAFSAEEMEGTDFAESVESAEMIGETGNE